MTIHTFRKSITDGSAAMIVAGLLGVACIASATADNKRPAAPAPHAAPARPAAALLDPREEPERRTVQPAQKGLRTPPLAHTPPRRLPTRLPQLLARTAPPWVESTAQQWAVRTLAVAALEARTAAGLALATGLSTIRLPGAPMSM